MTMIDWYKKVVFENYANFKGRARRSEFWWFTLFNFLIGMVFNLILYSIVGTDVKAIIQNGGNIPTSYYIINIISTIYSLAILVPSLAVTVRRLHDVGRSGWFFFLILVPIIGWIILLVWHFTDSQPGTNQWGPNPKEGNPQSFDFDQQQFHN